MQLLRSIISRTPLRGLWTYRGFIFGSVKREFKAKYGNAVLGAAWTVLNPLAMILVYTIIFSRIMHSRLPGVDSTYGYSIYLCAGILTWGLFAEIMNRGQNMFLENANLIKKISFPRICLPLIVVLNSSLNFAIIFGLFIFFLIFSGNFPGLVFFSFIPIIVLEVIFAISLAMIVGILNVFFRDVGQFAGIVIQFWFWLTPIVYPASILPDSVRQLLVYNPMAQIIQSYQTILVNGEQPVWLNLLPTLLLSIFICILAIYLFRKRAGEMVDEL
ncbi:ABC transporter permease [Undibacterium sp. SXout7W]|uniref:ABC transporter permease n=1 Tax=Undibacterium sp. SXout7W TaxID=3413049 RepID=UPI003BF1AE6E